MSFEAVNMITDAEALAKKKMADAETAAKQLIAKAEEDGKAAVKAALEKAAEEAAVLKAESGRRSDEKTGGILADAEKIRSELREQAEAKLDEAAELIVERIVNG